MKLKPVLEKSSVWSNLVKPSISSSTRHPKYCEPVIVSQPTIWAVVPAAGIGARFAADRPKQYLPLAGQLIAERSLNTLDSSGLF
ncbi:MAG: hypothetical protein HOO01_00340, partial [Cellvibrionales bacterium]|nr:hypothetical protein [Cellvibrionales bacterium]